MIINQIDSFISNLPSKTDFRRFLLDLKQTQEQELFTLEQEYLTLVRDRRTALINYLRTASVGDGGEGEGKRHIHDAVKQMHARTQAELDAFLKIRVYEAWKMGQLVKQRDALKECGFPSALLVGNKDHEELCGIMNYLLLKL